MEHTTIAVDLAKSICEDAVALLSNERVDVASDDGTFRHVQRFID
jgi:hypothetical protein